MNQGCYVERFFSSLFATPALHMRSQQDKYRNKITYSLPVTEFSVLAEGRVNDVCRAVQRWRDDDCVCLREVMVKRTRSGNFLVRLTIQYVTGSRCWESAGAFRDYLIDQFPTAIECLCYNVADSSARPSKESLLCFLTDATSVLETTPNGHEYQIGPDTFSEVNHEVELLQWDKTKEWLEEVHADGRSENAVLIVSGRDISSFGVGFGSLVAKVSRTEDHCRRMFSHVIAVQHCPLVHRDALHNFGRHRDKVDATVLHVAKAVMVHAFAHELQRHGGRPVVGVMTGGRKGLDPAYVHYLGNNEAVVCIIYNSCSTKSLLRDMKGFVDGGFYVEDFMSYDFLPGTGYTASLTKLLRRPRTLVLPVGPAGSGKSSLASQLVKHCPAVVWWQRDAIFVSLRDEGLGLAKSRQLVHQDLLGKLRVRGGNSVIVVDSTNGNADARKLYIQEAAPDLVVVVSLVVDGHDVLEFLLERTANRLGVNEANHPSFPDSVIEQRKKHSNILKGIEYPGDGESLGARTVLISCDIRDGESVAEVAYKVFLEFSSSGTLRRTANLS